MRLRPIACFPVFSFPTVVARFSNTLYKRKDNDQNIMAMIDLPYELRCVYRIVIIIFLQ